MTLILIKSGLSLLSEQPVAPPAATDKPAAPAKAPQAGKPAKPAKSNHSAKAPKTSKPATPAASSDEKSAGSAAASSNAADAGRLLPLVKCLAVTQVLLAVLAVTCYHVQIITRISSAYPAWYWWLARTLVERPKSRSGSVVVVFMIMYASIQAALFSFFLPPA